MLTRLNFALALIGTSAAAWTIDMRESVQDSQTIWLKGGETLDVLLDGKPSTGYSWINNIQYAEVKNDRQALDSHKIQFLEEADYKDGGDMLGGGLLGISPDEDDEDEIEFRPMYGATHSYNQKFQTEAG